MFLGNKIRLYITEFKKKNYIKFDQIKATYSKIKSSKVWSPLLLLGVLSPSSFFGKVLRSPLSLLAALPPSLPPWRLLSPPSVCFLPSSLGWCCSGASALDLSCRFSPLSFHVCVLFPCHLSFGFSCSVLRYVFPVFLSFFVHFMFALNSKKYNLFFIFCLFIFIFMFFHNFFIFHFFSLLIFLLLKKKGWKHARRIYLYSRHYDGVPSNTRNPRSTQSDDVLVHCPTSRYPYEP